MSQIKILSEPLADDFPVEWYEIADDNHFWFKWRVMAFLEQLRFLSVPLSASLKGLDIGCGHGVVRRQLEFYTLWDVDGADLNRDGLDQNKTKRGQTLLYNIHERNQDLRESYDLVILFDVLEHIDDTKRFLDSALYHLKRGGWLFINVPALNNLFSQFDRAMGHLKRYDEKMIKTELDCQSVNIKDIRYWGFSMLPLLLLRKFMLKNSGHDSTGNIIKKGIKPPHPWVNSLLMRLSRAEILLLKKPVLGSSLLAAAIKS